MSSGYIRDFPASPSNEDDLQGWLDQIYRYVEGEATEAIGWYLRHAKSKRVGSQITRYLAIFFGGVAGLLPILAAVWPDPWPKVPLRSEQFSLLGSLLLGIVALLVAIDRFSDFSSGWIRYVQAAFEIRTALQDFRMDWVSVRSQLPRPVKPEDLRPAVERAKKFVLAVERQIGDETRQWATEFERNLAQMEKEITAKWEARERELETQAETMRPGALQLRVTNAAKVDDRTFDVRLEPSEGTGDTRETVTGAATWVKVGLAPGMYKVTARATIGGKRAEDSKVIHVKAQQATPVELTLLE